MFAYVACALAPVVVAPPLLAAVVAAVLVRVRSCLRGLGRRWPGFHVGDLNGRGCGVVSRGSRSGFGCAGGMAGCGVDLGDAVVGGWIS